MEDPVKLDVGVPVDTSMTDRVAKTKKEMERCYVSGDRGQTGQKQRDEERVWEKTGG